MLFYLTLYILDSTLSFEKHVNNITRSAYIFDQINSALVSMREFFQH